MVCFRGRVLADDAREAVPLPDPVTGIVVREQRFGKSSTPQQDVQVRARRRAIQLAQGKRMQTKVAVAPGQGIAPLAVVIEAGGAGDDDAARGFLGVVDPLEQVRKKPIIVPFYS